MASMFQSFNIKLFLFFSLEETFATFEFFKISESESGKQRKLRSSNKFEQLRSQHHAPTRHESVNLFLSWKVLRNHPVQRSWVRDVHCIWELWLNTEFGWLRGIVLWSSSVEVWVFVLCFTFFFFFEISILIDCCHIIYTMPLTHAALFLWTRSGR